MTDHTISPRTGKTKGGHKKRNYTIDQYGVTKQQNKFVKEYIKDYCGAKAAIRAGYSKKSANEQASRMLAKVKIQDAILREEKALQNRFYATKAKVLRELSVIGFADIGDYVTVCEDGTVTINRLDTLPTSTSKAIKTLKEKTETLFREGGEIKKIHIEVALHDKLSALQMLGKELGMFKEKCEITGEDGGPIPIKLESMTDDELLAIIHRESARRGRSEGA